MPRIAGSSLKKSEHTRQSLLDAALRVIAAKGYSSATVDEIVKEAGVSKGVAYYHFKSKAQMASDILEKGIADLIAAFGRIVEDTQSATDALNDMLDMYAAELYDNQEFARFFMTELWRDGRIWSKDLRKHMKTLLLIVADQLKRGQVEGTIRADIDPEFGAVSIIGTAITDAVYYAGIEGSEPLIDKQAFVARIRDFSHHSLT